MGHRVADWLTLRHHYQHHHSTLVVQHRIRTTENPPFVPESNACNIDPLHIWQTCTAGCAARPLVHVVVVRWAPLITTSIDTPG